MVRGAGVAPMWVATVAHAQCALSYGGFQTEKGRNRLQSRQKKMLKGPGVSSGAKNDDDAATIGEKGSIERVMHREGCQSRGG